MVNVARNQENKLNIIKVPVIFVPGVMATRLELPPFEYTDRKGNKQSDQYIWDPDDAVAMLSLAFTLMKIYRISLILFLIINLSACSFVNNMTENQHIAELEKHLSYQPEGLKTPARINLEKVSFDVPQGFESDSSYSFQVPENDDQTIIGRVVIRTGVRKDAYQDFKSYRTDFYERMTKAAALYKALGNTSQYSETLQDKSLEVSKMPALLIVSKTVKDQPKFNLNYEYQQDLLIFDSQTTYIQITYNHFRNTAKESEDFLRVVRTIKFITNESESPKVEKTDNGMIRRYVGTFTLDVPETWYPTREFEFYKTLPNGKEAIMLGLFEPDLPLSWQPEKNNGTENMTNGTLKYKHIEDFKTPYFEGKLEKYLIVENEYAEKINPPMAHLVKKTVRRWARMKANDGTVIVIEGAVSSENELLLDEEFGKWINSFRTQGENR